MGVRRYSQAANQATLLYFQSFSATLSHSPSSQTLSASLRLAPHLSISLRLSHYLSVRSPFLFLSIALPVHLLRQVFSKPCISLRTSLKNRPGKDLQKPPFLELQNHAVLDPQNLSKIIDFWTSKSMKISSKNHQTSLS